MKPLRLQHQSQSGLILHHGTSILEYSAAVWDPHLQKEKTQLETIQRRAARFATNNYHERTTGCVNSMLQDLQWESLEERRQRNRLNLLHKINNNIVDVDINNFVRRNDSRTRGSQRFFQEHTTNQVFFNSFFPRTVRDWNKLPIRVSSTQESRGVLGLPWRYDHQLPGPHPLIPTSSQLYIVLSMILKFQNCNLAHETCISLLASSFAHAANNQDHYAERPRPT